MSNASSVVKLGAIASMLFLSIASPAIAAAPSDNRAVTRIGDNVGVRSGATANRAQRSKALGVPLAFLLLGVAAAGAAVYAIADDKDEPASPGS